MVYNVKNVVDLTQKTLSMIFTVPGCVFLDMGDLEEEHHCYNKNVGMSADDWQIRFGVKGR
jgi:hypothetical protein